MYILSIVLLLLNQLPYYDAGSPDNEGNEFVLAFSDNYPDGGSLDDQLFITTSKQRHIQVTVISPRFEDSLLNENFTVIAGTVRIVTVPARLTVAGFGISSKGIYITADDDIIVYGVNLETYSTDAFLCLPLDVMGQNYRTLSYKVANTYFDFSQILIVGVENQTHISLQIPERVSIDFLNENVKVDGQMITFTINSFDTFQIQSKSDLTGTYIKSSKPIAVFSGNRKTRVGLRGGTLDHISEQLLPVETWGMEFVVVPIPDRSVGDIVRIVASEYNTTLIKTSNNQTTEKYLHNPESFLEIDIKSDEYIYFKSNKPILVAQFIKSGSLNDPSDPSMIIVPAVHQFAAMYTFSTPIDPKGKIIKHYFMFVTKIDQLNTLRINGKPLQGEITHQVSGTDFIGGYIRVPEGTYRITQSSPVSVFSGILYGRATSQSYGLPIGLWLPRTNIVCSKTTTVEGDGIDNDCDGLIDEEICANNDELQVDDDEDGILNEDCARPLPVDGSWSTWGAWSTCNVTCLSSNEMTNGTQSRFRSCTNPKPMYDGFPCLENKTENRHCQADCSDILQKCQCPCRKVGRKWNHLLNRNLSQEQLLQALREEMARLRKEILIDKKNTVKYIYTKKSNSQDKRTTSKGLSLGMTVLISLPLVLIVLSDLHNLYIYLKKR